MIQWSSRMWRCPVNPKTKSWSPAASSSHAVEAANKNCSWWDTRCNHLHSFRLLTLTGGTFSWRTWIQLAQGEALFLWSNSRTSRAYGDIKEGSVYSEIITMYLTLGRALVARLAFGTFWYFLSHPFFTCNPFIFSDLPILLHEHTHRMWLGGGQA